MHVVSVDWWWKVGEVSAGKSRRKIGGNVPKAINGW
jgi:hypothetical protein